MPRIKTLKQNDDYPVLPIIFDSLDRYVNEGIPTGGFLNAVLENDLKEAFMRADFINAGNMRNIVAFCYFQLPANCWGNRKKVDLWIDHIAALKSLDDAICFSKREEKNHA